MQLDLSPTYRVLLPDATLLAICLVGCGGTGSLVAQALARLAYHCQEKGIAVDLTFVDPDTIEARNLGRQAFCPAELSANKAQTLALRLGTALGLSIRAVPEPFSTKALAEYWQGRALSTRYGTRTRRFLLVGAVDNHLARRELARAAERLSLWWLDCGNAHHSGQVLLGNLPTPAQAARLQLNDLGLCSGLPAPHLQAPALLEPDPTDAPALSCAELTLRAEQSLVVNQQVAAVAAQYLYQFMVQGELTAFETAFTLDPPTMRTKLITQANLASYLPQPKGKQKKTASTGKSRSRQQPPDGEG